MHPQKKVKIALTGGIGTGKTYISKKFFDIGIPVFYADEEAKKIYFSAAIVSFIKENFGDSLVINNEIDVIKLSEVVFSDIEKRRKLERVIHPLVMQQFEDWVAQQEVSIVMLESAIIFEAGLEHYFDKIFVVDASTEVRIERIRNRNPHLSEEEILQRINSQMSQEEKCRKADLVIWNG
ncbi:MAG: dephospho-CoA kinase [Bacteroidales bacterium]|jgi:dephospho-CoA kinase|nr:dephospho-CoA kinase [Bacteroidales bacterium]